MFLGGLEPMPQTRELLMNQGMTIDRAYIHTPVWYVSSPACLSLPSRHTQNFLQPAVRRGLRR